MSSLPNTIPNIAAPTLPERPAPRADEAARARNDDDRFAERLDRETSISESSRSESSRQETSRQETSRAESSRSETDRTERSEATDRPKTEASDKSDASAQTTSSDNTDEQVASDDTNNQETPAGTTGQSEEQLTGDVELSVDAALAFLSQMDGTQNPELTITARSGETISLTPPATAQNGQSEPGSLGRWFVEAAGPAGLAVAGLTTAGPDAQMAGLLSKMAPGVNPATGETPNLSSLIGQGNQNGLKPAGPSDGTALSSGQITSFADAMASANTSTETMDAMMGQAMAKAAAALDVGTSVTAPVTPGPTVATGAQPTMTAVPQSTAGQAVPVTALAVEINRQAMNGKTQFEIRLDPPELGRLNVRLEVDTNGQTRTHMVVERGETLDMLTTDSRSLERALQQAGLKAEPGSVTFELAQDFNEGLAQNGNQSETDENSGNDSASSDGTQTSDENLIPDLTDMSSVEAVRQQLYLTGHLDVRV